MQLSERLLEVLQALYWNLGSDPAQEIAIDWFLDEGKLQTGRSANGQPILIDVIQKTLQDLANLELIEMENRAGPSSDAFMGHHSHTVVRLLPKALEFEGLMAKSDVVNTDNNRYAHLTLDTYEFAKMLEETFSIEEQKDLSLRLGLDYESVVPSNATKTESARSIVDRIRRDSRLMDLWCACVQVRPNSGWTLLLRG